VAWALAGCDPHSSVTCASSIFGGFAAKFAEACQDPIRFLETRYDVMCPACVMGYKSAIAMQKIVTLYKHKTWRFVRVEFYHCNLHIISYARSIQLFFSGVTVSRL